MLQKNVLKPFLYRFCWACHRSVSRHFPGPNLGDGHMPECRVCLIAGAPPPSKTETPKMFEGGGSKSVPSKLNLSNCQITVHFLSPVPYKLISRYFRGVLDDVGCMFIVVPYICEVLENFWWLRGVNILKLKKFCLIHRTFDSFKSVCIITQLLLLNRSRRVYTKVTLVSSSPGIAPSHVNGTSKASWSTHQNLTDDSAIKPIYIYICTCNEATNSSCGHDFCTVWFDDSISYFVIPFFKFRITYEHWR